MKKIFKISFLFIISFSVLKTNIIAANLTYTKGSQLTCSDYQGGYIYDKSGTYNGNSGTAYCISGPDKAAPESGTCTVDSSYSSDDKLAFGTIIKNNSGSQCAAEVALYNYISNSISVTSDTNYLIGKSNFSPTLSPNSLEFSESGSNYVSQVITVGGNDYIDSFTCTSTNTNVSIIDKTNTSFKVQIPKASVNSNTEINVTCNVKQKAYTTSETFICPGNDVQKLAFPIVNQRSKDLPISGTIEQKKGSIKIIKKGKDSKVLEGVKFQIKNSKGKTINAAGKEETNYIFTTDKDGIIEVKDIELSKTATENVYTIEEIETLPGYIKYKTVTKVTLTEDNLNVTKTIVNNIVKLTISKTDATGQKELKGAKLSILDKNGKVLKKCIFDDENNLITYSDNDDAKACTWVSTDKSRIVEGLPVGKYYLVEDLAPTGYTKSSEKIEIEITEDGAVKDKIVMKNALEVKVPDTLSGKSALLLAIAMFDIALGIGIYIYVKNNKIEE